MAGDIIINFISDAPFSPQQDNCCGDEDGGFVCSNEVPVVGLTCQYINPEHNHYNVVAAIITNIYEGQSLVDLMVFYRSGAVSGKFKVGYSDANPPVPGTWRWPQ